MVSCMLDEAAELLLELGLDWLIDRNDDRTMRKQVCLFLGVVAALVAVVLVVSSPLYGVAAGAVALALLFAGV